jgi:hypothetical protein
MQKAWIFCGISTSLAIVFAGLYFFNPKTVEKEMVRTSTHTVTNIFTNDIIREVVKEVPKEVEKIVKVPADIPVEYIAAVQAVSNFDNCDFVKNNQVLFGMKDVQVVCLLADSLKDSVSEDEVRAKFELVLRRNNVPISPTSINFVTVTVDGFWGDPPIYTMTYSVAVKVYDTQTLLRGGQLHKATITVWEKGYFGFAGKQVANKGVESVFG